MRTVLRLGRGLYPSDPSKVDVTTFGSFVWHGPAAGDPQAPEDVIGVR